MLWERAKNYMLIFFLLINLLLLALVWYETDTHVLPRERVNAINAVLMQNNINISYPIPTDFRPMRALQVANYDYDIERLKSIFFPAYADISHTGGNRRSEFTWQNIRLVIDDGRVFFTSGLGVTGVPDYAAALMLTQAFIDEYYPDFVFDAQSTRQARRGGLRLFFRQKYQNHVIHSNFIEFLITGTGDELVIEEADIHYLRPLGFAYQPRDLIAPDEALLTFVQEIRRQTYEPVLITYMDIAYVSFSGRGQQYAEPVYRIFIDGGDEPFLVNAYTNRVVW